MDSRDTASPPRRVRSFVIRGGRLTASQQQALEESWPRWGIDDVESRLDAERVFGRRAPLVMEIGFGMGDSLALQAEQHPDRDFIGVEVHRPGVGKLLRELDRRSLQNVRVYCHDGREILENCIPDDSLDTLQVFFPDPWHKKRHHKRRLIQSGFAALARRKLVPGGTLHVATDWPDYAEHIMAVLSAEPGLENTAGEGRYRRNTGRPVTKFEKRGQRRGHRVWDLVFRKQDPDS